MNLVVIAAFIAVCGSAKLDRTYLPPSSAVTAGGSPGSLQVPLTRSSEQGLETPRLPIGGFTNNFDGVVVDAASPGTRASAADELSGLGGSRPSYGSTDSKVGDAAFRGSVGGFRNTPSFGASGVSSINEQGNFAQNGLFNNNEGQNIQIDTHNAQFPQQQEGEGQAGFRGAQGFQSSSAQTNFGQISQNFDENKSERPQAAKDRNSNILVLSNDVNADSYSYGFETDNGIAVGENGVAINGVQAEGEYSYQGDDGQVYKVTYTADEGGYRPQGAHLPTPPPIPEEILKSLEQNAKEEAAGLVDDGSYDAQKYNENSDYTHDNSGNIQYNGAQLSQFGKRPESNAASSGTVASQNSQDFGKPVPGQFGNGLITQNTHIAHNGQSAQLNSDFGSGQFGVSPSTQNLFNGQSSQINAKLESEQTGITGSESGASQPGSGLQKTDSTFEQSGQEDRNQFGSNSAVDGSSSLGGGSSQITMQHMPIFGQNGENPFTSQSAQDQNAFGSAPQFGNKFGQQAAASFQFENNSPGLLSQQNQKNPNPQFGSQSKRPSFGQSTDNSAFGSSFVQPQFGSSFKPQGLETFAGSSLKQEQEKQDFGKPFPQSFNGQNLNRPSADNYNFNKPQSNGLFNVLGSTNSFNRIPQAPSRFGANNEYLPPTNDNDQFKNDNSKYSISSIPNANRQEIENKDQSPDIDAHKQEFSFTSTSASASVGQSPFKQRPVKPLNIFNTQPQSKPQQQFTQQFIQPTNQFVTPVPSQFNSNPKLPSFLTSQTLSTGSKPTAVPDTELTTPLKPNESTNSENSKLSSQIQPSDPANFGSFSSNPISNKAQTESNLQFGTDSNQSTFQSLPDTNGKPQLSQNYFGQNQQAQTPLNQGNDNSYYYNQPSKPFGSRPQGSKFPSSPSYQSNGIASQNQFVNSFQNPTKLPGSQSIPPVIPTSSTQFTQNQNYNGITQAAISSFPSVSPTLSSQAVLNQNNQFGSTSAFNQQFYNQPEGSKPNFNQQPKFSYQSQGIGSQQSKPTITQQANSKLSSRPQFGQKPVSSSPLAQTQIEQENKPTSLGVSSNPQNIQSQQYQGTVYEYNKPAEVLPASSQTDTPLNPTINTDVTSEVKPSDDQSKGNQPNIKPFSAFGRAGSILNAQNNKLFGNIPSTTQFKVSQSSSPQTGIQFGSEPAKQVNKPSNVHFSQAVQSSAQLSKSSASTQFSQISQNTQSPQLSSFKEGNQGKQQFGSQISQFRQPSQSFGSSQSPQPARGLQTRFGSQTSQNVAPSKDNGYFYPGNPMPQFFETAKNQFGLNFQSNRPQSIGNFNQNLQSQSSQPSESTSQQSSQPDYASRPEFGAQPKQFNQFAQAQFGQKMPISAIQPGQAQIGQSIATSQAIASGQAYASATSSTSPQNGQSIDTEAQNPGSNAQESSEDSSKPYGALNLKPFGAHAQGSSKPLFNGPCCQGFKDSSPAQSTDRPNPVSFEGTQSYNAQSFAGKGEQFGGPRQPPRFDDQTGYHY